MSDTEKRIRYLYMYYLKEQVIDNNAILSYILDDIGSNLENVKLTQSILKDERDLSSDVEEQLLEGAKELEEQGYFDPDSYVNILENCLDQDKQFSIKKAFEYLNHLKYDPDSELYEDLDDTEMFESYIKKGE